MPTLSIEAQYRKNEGIVISPEELLLLYLYGFNDIGSQDGSSMSSENIRFYILAAQREIEQFLGIKFNQEFIDENFDYYRDDYMQGFPFVNTTWQVLKPYSWIGMLNTVEQIVYPEQWLNWRQSSNSLNWRKISIVPNGSMTHGDANVIYTGVTAYYGLRSLKQVPDYWYIQYTTGFTLKNMPWELLNVVGMYGVIPVLAIYGDLILGAGIASQSLSIDGLSQSISSTSSATNSGLGSRIVEYRKTVKETLEHVKKTYRGIAFTVA